MSEGTFSSQQTDPIADEESDIPQTNILPPDIVGDGSIKIFNKWSYEDIDVKDISLTYHPSHPTTNK
jgi:hypothetical protein